MPTCLFREGVDISEDGNDMIVITPYATRSNPNRQTLRIKDAKKPIKRLLKELTETGIECNEYLAIKENTESESKYLALERHFKMLYKNGLLICEIYRDNKIAMQVLPINPGPIHQTCPDNKTEIVLSKFTSIQPCLDSLDITTPLSPTTLRLQDQQLYPLIQRLVSPCTLKNIKAILPEDLRAQYRNIVTLLLSSGAVGICNNNNNAEIDQETITAGWNRHDLCFHRHTRGHFIDTYKQGLLPKAISKKSPPAKYQRIILNTVSLPKPSLKEQYSNFYQIIQARKTIRSYSSEPITARALGTLLWYSMHTREEITCDPGLLRSYEGLLRPVASAGGLHSIELYLCIKQCIGIRPGFYHYDTYKHILGKISDLNKPCKNMLEMAVNTTCRAPQVPSVSFSQGQQPDVLIVMATRYERNASLHAETGLAYALILKDAGAIYQQLYLVATALKLAPCGMSFGSSELFEQASGITSNLECSVGEFMIGNPG